MNSIYFEEQGEVLLEKIGMLKAEFARKMGIQRQNVRVLFKSKDLRVIQRAADVMGVPWIFLVGYAEEPDEYDVPEDTTRDDSFEIAPEDIPTGDSVEDRRRRQKLIQVFYAHWKEINPELRVFNDSLQDHILCQVHLNSGDSGACCIDIPFDIGGTAVERNIEGICS